MLYLFQRKMFFVRKHFKRNHFLEKNNNNNSPENIFWHLARSKNEGLRNMPGNFQQTSADVRRFEKEKFNLQKWFTLLKKENYFMKIK